MNFTESVKKEIMNKNSFSACCVLAALSAYVRTSGTLIVEGGKIGFSISADNEECINYIVNFAEKVFGEKAVINKGSGKKSRIKAQFLSDSSLRFLIEAGIVVQEGNSISLALNIDKYLIENACCKKAYVVGAFLGSGSVTVPNENDLSTTGYHLEFVFSKYVTAQDFATLLGECDVTPGLIERNDCYVVYINSAGDLVDVLKIMNAEDSAQKVLEIVNTRERKNNANRVVNCEMSNISKQINAFIKQREAIKLIEDTLGIDSLPPQLKEVVQARNDNPEDTMVELAQKLGISKSCLNHRLRKIMEIANSVK